MFRDGMAQMAKSFHERGWNVVPLYADENARCRENCPSTIDTKSWSVDPIAESIGVPSEKIMPATIRNLVGSLVDAVEEMTPDSQLLLIFYTHGSPKGKSRYHSICAEKRMLFSVNNPAFIDLLKGLKDKGIKLGFIDFSCYGGATVPVLGELGCAVSSDGAWHEGSVLSASTFIEFLRSSESQRKIIDLDGNGKTSLEEYYLLSLVTTQPYLFRNVEPQISGAKEFMEIGDLISTLNGKRFESSVNPNAKYLENKELGARVIKRFAKHVSRQAEGNANVDKHQTALSRFFHFFAHMPLGASRSEMTTAWAPEKLEKRIADHIEGNSYELGADLAKARFYFYLQNKDRGFFSKQCADFNIFP